MVLELMLFLAAMEIGGNLNYDNASIFSRAFRDVMGIKQNIYRRSADKLQ